MNASLDQLVYKYLEIIDNLWLIYQSIMSSLKKE